MDLENIFSMILNYFLICLGEKYANPAKFAKKTQ